MNQLIMKNSGGKRQRAEVVASRVQLLGPGLLPNFPPVISRVRRLLTCPAKAYQVEVEKPACMIGLRPV